MILRKEINFKKNHQLLKYIESLGINSDEQSTIGSFSSVYVSFVDPIQSSMSNIVDLLLCGTIQKRQTV